MMLHVWYASSDEVDDQIREAWVYNLAELDSSQSPGEAESDIGVDSYFRGDRNWGYFGGDRNWWEILKLSELRVIGDESPAANS